MSKNILVTGANGQLGSMLRKTFPEATFFGREAFDITDQAAYEKLNLDSFDYFINAAAMTNVDGAEAPEGRKLAWQLNGYAVSLMAKYTTLHNICLIHISSDYVFDGSHNIHYEDESFSPLGVYGQSKAAGDLCASLNPKHYIIRTSWVIGEGNNFVTTMKSLAERNITPTVVSDQIGRLTFTHEISRGIQHLIDSKSPYGTYNISNDGSSTNWSDIAKLVYTHSGKSDSDVTPVTTEEYYANKEGIAPRPLQSTLSLDKIKATGFVSQDWDTALTAYLETLN